MPNLLGGEAKTDLSTDVVMKLIDYTNLKAFTQEKQIETMIDHAARLGTYAICILPTYASFARKVITLKKLKLKLVVVVDYPLGGNTESQRINEVSSLAGIADEIDAVARIGALKSGKFDEVEKDIDALTRIAHLGGIKIKVIIETAYLTRVEKEKASGIVFKSGADFIKTSSGFAEKEYTASVGNSNTGATVEDIKLIAAIGKKIKKTNIGIKASGGIRTSDQIFALLAASGRKPDPNLFRVGASSIDNIYNELKSR